MLIEKSGDVHASSSFISDALTLNKKPAKTNGSYKNCVWVQLDFQCVNRDCVGGQTNVLWTP